MGKCLLQRSLPHATAGLLRLEPPGTTRIVLAGEKRQFTGPSVERVHVSSGRKGARILPPYRVPPARKTSTAFVAAFIFN